MGIKSIFGIVFPVVALAFFIQRAQKFIQRNYILVEDFCHPVTQPVDLREARGK